VREGDDDDRIRERTKKVLDEMSVDEASTLPYVLELLSVKDSGIDALGLSPECIRDRTLEALIRIVLKGAEIRPLVMAVEDLHWVDRSSEDTLKSLLDAISGAQVLLIFTYRPQFVHTWGTKSYHNQVNLMRLSNRETLAMAAHILGTEQVGGDLEELILEKTEGIPFFVEEFMKSLMDLEMIQWNDSGYYLADNVRDVAIPSTIQDVIMARVDSLPEGAKNVLQVGSAIGREFSCELVKRVMGLTEQELNPHLSVLRDSELVYERGIYPRANYIFRHSLTQEVAYESLLLKRKHEIHERIGRAAEDLYSDRIEEFYEVLAYHYSRSRNVKKAYQYLRLSGDKASRRYSNWEAFRCYRQAVEKLNALPETQENKRNVIDVLLSMEGPMKLLAYPEDSLEILHEGERLSLELGHERGLATFYSCMGLCYTFNGEPLRGIEYTERCFGAAESLADLDLMAQTAFDLCSSYAVAGQYREIIRVAPPVLALLEKTHREADIFGVAFNFNLYSALSAYYGHAKSWSGEFEEGEALCEKGLRFSKRFDNLYCTGMVESVYGLSYVAKGDGRNAVEHLSNAVRYAEQAQIFPILSIACGALGWGYCLLGDFHHAEECIEQGISYASDADLPMMGAIHHLALGLARLESGDIEGARGRATEALKLARANNERHLEGPASILLGRILGRAGIAHAGAAEEHIRHGIELMEASGLRPWASMGYFTLGELYAGQGQNEQSLENLKRAEADFADMGMDHWARESQKVLQRV
jgi:tetratricopeptide (TPR) repeat protein